MLNPCKSWAFNTSKSVYNLFKWLKLEEFEESILGG